VTCFRGAAAPRTPAGSTAGLTSRPRGDPLPRPRRPSVFQQSTGRRVGPHRTRTARPPQRCGRAPFSCSRLQAGLCHSMHASTPFLTAPQSAPFLPECCGPLPPPPAHARAGLPRRFIRVTHCDFHPAGAAGAKGTQHTLHRAEHRDATGRYTPAPRVALDRRSLASQGPGESHTSRCLCQTADIGSARLIRMGFVADLDTAGNQATPSVINKPRPPSAQPSSNAAVAAAAAAAGP
jgi:hypothetical protein